MFDDVITYISSTLKKYGIYLVKSDLIISVDRTKPFKVYKIVYHCVLILTRYRIEKELSFSNILRIEHSLEG